MKKAALLPFQLAGVRFLTERRFAILADDPGLGKTRQALTAISEVETPGALILVPSVANRNLWEAEISAFPGMRVDRSKTGILPSRGTVRVTTAAELMRRKLSPKVAPLPSSILVLDEPCLYQLGGERLRPKLARLADVFARVGGAIWLLQSHPDYDRLSVVLETVRFMLRRRVAGPLCDYEGCEATATVLTMDSKGPKPHRRCVRRRCAKHQYEPDKQPISRSVGRPVSRKRRP